MREHNKFMNVLEQSEQVMNLEEYIAYAQGNHKPKSQPMKKLVATLDNR